MKHCRCETVDRGLSHSISFPSIEHSWNKCERRKKKCDRKISPFSITQLLHKKVLGSVMMMMTTMVCLSKGLLEYYGNCFRSLHPELALLSPFFSVHIQKCRMNEHTAAVAGIITEFFHKQEVESLACTSTLWGNFIIIIILICERIAKFFSYSRWRRNCALKKFTDGSASSSTVSRDNSFLPPRVYYVDGSTTVRNLSSAELLWIQRSHDQHQQPVRSIFTMFQIVHCRCSRSQSVISCWVISPLYRSIILWNGRVREIVSSHSIFLAGSHDDSLRLGG